MAIVLSPDVEARLLERARRAGRDINSVATEIILSSLNRDMAGAGVDYPTESRLRSLEALFDEQRTRHRLSSSWPHRPSKQDRSVVEAVRDSAPLDSVGQELHCRKCSGEVLSDDEEKLVRAWYDANDLADLSRADMSRVTDLAGLNEALGADKERLARLAENARSLAEGNARLRDENAKLQSEAPSSRRSQ
jgi:serine phosphatase RsbU (regulator of sigma subunit)